MGLYRVLPEPPPLDFYRVLTAPPPVVMGPNGPSRQTEIIWEGPVLFCHNCPKNTLYDGEMFTITLMNVDDDSLHDIHVCNDCVDAYRE